MKRISIKSGVAQKMTAKQIDNFVTAYMGGVKMTLDQESTDPIFDVALTLPESIEATDGIYSDCKERLEKEGVSVSGEEAVRILDPEVLRVLIENGVIQTDVLFLKSAFFNVKTIGTWFYNNTKITHLDLHDSGITTLSANSLRGTTNLKYLRLPDTTTSLGQHCLNACGIEELDLNNVSYIDSWGLANLSKLKVLRIHRPFSSGRQMTEYGVTKNFKIVIPSIKVWMGMSYANVLDKNTCILTGQGGCSLCFEDDEDTIIKHVTIPIDVTSVKFGAFYKLTDIEHISYEGTIEQWLAMSKGTSWHTNVPATYVQCSDGRCGLDDTTETGNTYAG